MSDTKQPDISAQVQLTWACDFQDGPLSGLCEVDGEVCWFDCIDEEVKGGPRNKHVVRTLQVYRLTEEQRDAEVKRHLCFVENVGRQFDYVQNRKLLNTGNIRPDRFWRKYHEKYPDHKNRMGVYDANEVIGIFYEKNLSKKKPSPTPA
jgi:hypothetical protein